MQKGEEQVWDILDGLEAEEVCTRCNVSYETSSSTYHLKSFSCDIIVCIQERTLKSYHPTGSFLVNDLGIYSRLAILWYLIKAKNIPLSGELINPSTLPGGEMFLRGTHILPLDMISSRFGTEIPAFFEAGRGLGASKVVYADASLKLFPVPGIPVFLLLWEGDEEFSANSSILFDSTCVAQLPTDIIWAIAMMSIHMMLRLVK